MPASSPREESILVSTVNAWRESLYAMPRARLVLASVAVLVLIGVAALLAIVQSNHPIERTTMAPVATDEQLVSAFRAGNGMPVISVQSIDKLGVSGASTIRPGALRSKLRDAISRFDEFNVTSELIASVNHSMTAAERLPASKYQLGGTVENHDDRGTTLSLWLADGSDGALVWSRTFDNPQAGTAPDATEDPIARDVAVALAGPSGIIHAHARGKSDIDPRYACLLRAYAYLYDFDPRLHGDVRTCLERLTKLDPTFAHGFSALSMVYYREYSSGVGVLPGDSPPLDRALKAAQRAVALKPQSARAHEALLLSHFARGALAEALAEGEAALLLNPLDRSVPALYGMILVASGQLDKGEALLKEASAGTSLNATWVSAYLFVVSYLKGNLAAASGYARLDVSDTYPLGIVARALVAAQTGDRNQTQRLTEQLVTLYPVFGEDPRRALERLIRSPELLDRLTHDLAAIGLGSGDSSLAR